MTEIQQNLAKIREQLPSNVQLVAVSKFHPAEMIQQCYEQGQRIFGESHEQELRIKVPEIGRASCRERV